MNIAGFAKECIQVAFEGCDLGGGDIQDLAVKHGLLQQVAFDPAKHYDPDSFAEEGDVWFEYTDEFNAFSAAPTPPSTDLITALEAENKRLREALLRISKLEIDYRIAECAGLSDWAAFEAGLVKAITIASDIASTALKGASHDDT